MAEATLDTVELTAEEFANLADYSLSMPTGVVVGKRWRRNQNALSTGSRPEWLLGEYVEDVVPGQVRIRWSRIILRPGARAATTAPPIPARARYELEHLDAHRYVVHVYREDGLLGGKIGISRSLALTEGRFAAVMQKIAEALGATEVRHG